MALEVGIAACPRADLAPLAVAAEGGAFGFYSTYRKRLLFVNEKIPAIFLPLHTLYFCLGGLPPALVLRMAAIFRK